MADDLQCTEREAGEDLPAQLCGLLAEQIASARQGNMGQAERLGAQVSALVGAMTAVSTDSPRILESQWSRLRELYHELALILKAEQGEVQAQLTQLRHVKRVVGVYNRKKGR